MKVVVIGGTGSLGSKIIEHFIKDKKFSEIVCFSRDELKQSELKGRLNERRVSFVLGDIREYDSVYDIVGGAYSVFNCAAYKRIPEMESFPEEAIKTNVQGTINTFRACHNQGVSHYIFSSTDKAVEPINAYGMTKALAEKYLLSKIDKTAMKVHIYRWGNVLGSRGSVIPYFVDCIDKGIKPNITDTRMTRFWIRLKDAVSFMTDSYYWKESGLKIPSDSVCKSAFILDVLKATSLCLGQDEVNYKVSGIRPGEKIHEKLKPVWSSASGPFWSPSELQELISEPV